MTKHSVIAPPAVVVRRQARRVLAAAAGGLALTAAATVPATAATSAEDQSAVGAVVTCASVGALTGTSGYLRQREDTTFDGLGRAHVLFTIAAVRIELAGLDGNSYRLVGAGYDNVIYPGRDVTGDVVREDEQFYFDVVSAHRVVGVVRFRLNTNKDQITRVHDASTCQLPNMS